MDTFNERVNCKGGVLGDEMGLGKTLDGIVCELEAVTKALSDLTCTC